MDSVHPTIHSEEMKEPPKKSSLEERRHIYAYFKDELHKKLDSSLQTFSKQNDPIIINELSEECEDVMLAELENADDFKRMTQKIIDEKVKANQANRAKELEDLEWISNFYIARQRRAVKKPARDLINSIKFGRENVDILSKKKDAKPSYPVQLEKLQKRRIAQWRKGNTMHEAPGRPNFKLGWPSEDEHASIQQRYSKPKKTASQAKNLRFEDFPTRKQQIPISRTNNFSNKSFSDLSDTDEAKFKVRKQNRKKLQQKTAETTSDEIAEKHERKMLERFEKKLVKHAEEKSTKEIFKRKDPFQFQASSLAQDYTTLESRDIRHLHKQQITEMTSKNTGHEHQVPKPKLSFSNDQDQSNQIISRKPPTTFFSTVSSLFAKMKKLVTIGQKQIVETQEVIDQLKRKPEIEHNKNVEMMPYSHNMHMTHHHHHRHRHVTSELHQNTNVQKYEENDQYKGTLPRHQNSESAQKHDIDDESNLEKTRLNVRFSESTKIEDKHSKYRRKHIKTYSKLAQRSRNHADHIPNPQIDYDKAEFIDRQRNLPLLLKVNTPLPSDQHLKHPRHHKLEEFPKSHSSLDEVTAGHGHLHGRSNLNRRQHKPKPNPIQPDEFNDKQFQIQAPSAENEKFQDKSINQVFPEEAVNEHQEVLKREQSLLIKVKVPLSLPKATKEPDPSVLIKEPVRILKWVDDQKKRTFEDEFDKIKMVDDTKNIKLQHLEPRRQFSEF